jgi:hypothetical protein
VGAGGGRAQRLQAQAQLLAGAVGDRLAAGGHRGGDAGAGDIRILVFDDQAIGVEDVLRGACRLCFRTVAGDRGGGAQRSGGDGDSNSDFQQTRVNRIRRLHVEPFDV